MENLLDFISLWIGRTVLAVLLLLSIVLTIWYFLVGLAWLTNKYGSPFRPLVWLARTVKLFFTSKEKLRRKTGTKTKEMSFEQMLNNAKTLKGYDKFYYDKYAWYRVMYQYLILPIVVTYTKIYYHKLND